MTAKEPIIFAINREETRYLFPIDTLMAKIHRNKLAGKEITYVAGGITYNPKYTIPTLPFNAAYIDVEAIFETDGKDHDVKYVSRYRVIENMMALPESKEKGLTLYIASNIRTLTEKAEQESLLSLTVRNRPPSRASRVQLLID